MTNLGEVGVDKDTHTTQNERAKSCAHSRMKRKDGPSVDMPFCWPTLKFNACQSFSGLGQITPGQQYVLLYVAWQPKGVLFFYIMQLLKAMYSKEMSRMESTGMCWQYLGG